MLGFQAQAANIPSCSLMKPVSRRSLSAPEHSQPQTGISGLPLSLSQLLPLKMPAEASVCCSFALTGLEGSAGSLPSCERPSSLQGVSFYLSWTPGLGVSQYLESFVSVSERKKTQNSLGKPWGLPSPLTLGKVSPEEGQIS